MFPHQCSSVAPFFCSNLAVECMAIASGLLVAFLTKAGQSGWLSVLTGVGTYDDKFLSHPVHNLIVAESLCISGCLILS